MATNFIDHHEIMFTQAMIDTPMPGWSVIREIPDDEESKAVAVEHNQSKHRWELRDFDELKQAYIGIRVQ